MEWVEAVGKTVDEATEQALDQLGVAMSDAELIVVSEPKPGLFGRMRGEARVRARVRPVGARPKRERSRRGGSSRQGQGRQSPQKGTSGAGSSGRRGSSSSSGSGSGAGSRSGSGSTADGSVGTDGAGASDGANGSSGGRSTAPGTGTSRSARRRRNRSRAKAGAGSSGPVSASAVATDDALEGATADGGADADGSGGGPNGSASATGARRAAPNDSQVKETEGMAEGMTLDEQGEAGRAFVAGLLSEYGIEASVETRVLDEDTVEIAATGEDLGVLVGPRGSTLSAVQDLTRAVVQRQCPSRTDRILVDVAGYRERRSAALKRFSVQIAEEVLASGQERALEAMSPADRKAVHDAVNEMDGVATRSEGEDPHRYIVIAPAG
ncbi:MAG TPA: RNA-binding cell elongation regulator Jag/EloR [Acidimicrobiales bacterium]